MITTLLVSVPTGLDPALIAMAVLRAVVVLAVLGVVVRGYLRRRRSRDQILRESRRWVDDEEE
jgi:hypothetical protein